MTKFSNRLGKTLFYVAILFTILLQSCRDPHVNFHIHNKTEDPIDNIILSATGRPNNDTFNLASGNSIKYELTMSNIPKHDGNYIISYSRNGNTEYKNFGYYTNGYPLSDNYDLTIMSDTLYIKEYSTR